MSVVNQSPEDFCQERLQHFSQRTARLARRLNRLVSTKLTCIYSVIGYAVFDYSALGLIPVLLVLLVPVAIVQSWIGRRLDRAERCWEFHRHALARIDGSWVGDGEGGEDYRNPETTFADDLDIFGQASLFQFLCASRTSIGSTTLADWLNHPATADEINKRSAAVRELANDSEFRERLAILKRPTSAVDCDAVQEWASVPEVLPGWSGRLFGFALAVAFCIVVRRAFDVPLPILVIVVGLEFVLFLMVRNRLRRISGHAASAVSAFRNLHPVGVVLKTSQFASPRLREIKTAISESGSGWRAKIGCAVYRITAELPLPLLLAVQCLPFVERWRNSLTRNVARGLQALGDLDALASLAQFAFVQPAANFPEIVATETCFEALELGHPLLPKATRVLNDVRLNSEMQLFIVSGSNMSGKSTMLRTVGINTVLALCGAPVCAKSMRVSTFSIGTAMRFSDSLEHGTSYFFAVIRRLRRVMDLQSKNDNEEDRPLLFLIDEILQGTNSRDRIEGAKAIVRRLTERGGIGMVTTHDLELTRIEDTFGGRAANVHFVDQLKDGTIQFDYKMRPGVVQSSNALELMRSMGLDV